MDITEVVLEASEFKFIIDSLKEYAWETEIKAKNTYYDQLPKRAGIIEGESRKY